MLRVSRKVGQKIYIYPTDEAKEMTVEELFSDGDICIELTKVRGSQVKLAVHATEHLIIAREELI